jgi:hypothetical protein
MEFGTTLVPVPTSGFLFIAHLLDYFAGEVTFKADSVNVHKLD